MYLDITLTATGTACKFFTGGPQVFLAEVTALTTVQPEAHSKVVFPVLSAYYLYTFSHFPEWGRGLNLEFELVVAFL